MRGRDGRTVADGLGRVFVGRGWGIVRAIDLCIFIGCHLTYGVKASYL